jgi:hypothetical protein
MKSILGTSTRLNKLQRLGFGDINSAPNAVELSAAETMITLAHEEVTRFNAALRAQAPMSTNSSRRGGSRR